MDGRCAGPGVQILKLERAVLLYCRQKGRVVKDSHFKP